MFDSLCKTDNESKKEKGLFWMRECVFKRVTY